MYRSMEGGRTVWGVKTGCGERKRKNDCSIVKDVETKMKVRQKNKRHFKI